MEYSRKDERRERYNKRKRGAKRIRDSRIQGTRGASRRNESSSREQYREYEQILEGQDYITLEDLQNYLDNQDEKE